jgi:hypothetical protein
MRKHSHWALAALTCIGMYSCQKDQKIAASNPALSSEIAAKISALGFSSANAVKTADGYLVEGDIELTDELLNTNSTQQLLRIAETEQYRTTNLVSRLPRVVKIKVTGLGTAYITGTDTAIARYNRLGLRLTFQRITSGSANITISGFNQGPSGGYITLGSGGFPTGGNPYKSIKLNTNTQAYGANPNILLVGSVIQHEIGHCIGFRHTDYMNRAYSCGGSADNEGASSVGAILIPGTPSTPDAESFMLACAGGNRTFNANDIKALNYLYK